MNDGPILITHPWRPDDPGCIVLAGLIDDRLRQQLAWVDAGRSSVGPPVAYGPRVKLQIEPVRGSRWANRLLWHAGLYDTALGFRFEQRVSEAVDELAAIALQVRARALWCVAHEYAVPINERLAERLGLPVHVTVHDEPVSWVGAHTRWPHTAARAIQRSWPALLQRAASIDVISPGMRDEVLRVSGRESLVVPPVPRLPIGHLAPRDLTGRPLRIGVNGSRTSMDEALVALLRGCERWATPPGTWLPAEIEVHWLAGAGRRSPAIDAVLRGPFGRRVRLLPRTATEEEAVAALADCDVLYLPFWHPYDTFNRCSNPSRLCLYLPAARPIIFHTPDDSVLARWSREQRIGTCWTTRDPSDLPAAMAQATAELRDWPALRQRYLALLEGPLNAAAYRQRLGEQLDQLGSNSWPAARRNVSCRS